MDKNLKINNIHTVTRKAWRFDMKISKKNFNTRAVASAAVLPLIVVLCVCTKLPEDCEGKVLDPDKEFCFEGKTYAKCGGKECLPDVQFCYKEKVYDRCEGKVYDPAVYGCSGGKVYNRVDYVYYGANETHKGCVYFPETQFCHTNTVYEKCANSTYDPTTQGCLNNAVVPKCGNTPYDSATQICENGVAKAPCGNGFYNVAAQFCSANVIYAKCAGITYDPINQTCDNNIVRTKCGDDYYNPDLQFCFSNAIYTKCGGKDYDPNVQYCNNNAIARRTKVTVTFDANGAAGTAPASITVNAGDSVMLPINGTLSMDGYVFGGWNTNAAGTGTNFTAGTKAKVNGTDGGIIALYAKWNRIVTVTFNANGGEGAVGSMTAGSGSAIILPPQDALRRIGYSACGWNTNAVGTGTNYAAGASFNVTGDNSATLTLYAKWVRVVTVIFDANGGNGEVEPMTADSGTNIILPGQNALAMEGYKIGGWNTNAAGTGVNYATGATFNVTGNSGATLTIYAKWNAFFTDVRDDKKYTAVKIGSQTWMAENMNYAADGVSWCYSGTESNCDKYGRLYTWEAARTACPAGWHLPSREEWGTLAKFVGGTGTDGNGVAAGTMLKSKSGWNAKNGADHFGFSALPGGYRLISGTFGKVGNYGNWWTATEYDVRDAWYREMSYDYDGVGLDGLTKTFGFSVRCVADN